jgi:hypothetical protein
MISFIILFMQGVLYGSLLSGFTPLATLFTSSGTYVSDAFDEKMDGLHFGIQRDLVEGYVAGKEEGDFWEVQLLSLKHTMIQRAEKPMLNQLQASLHLKITAVPEACV